LKVRVPLNLESSAITGACASIKYPRVRHAPKHWRTLKRVHFKIGFGIRCAGPWVFARASVRPRPTAPDRLGPTEHGKRCPDIRGCFKPTLHCMTRQDGNLKLTTKIVLSNFKHKSSLVRQVDSNVCRDCPSRARTGRDGLRRSTPAVTAASPSAALAFGGHAARSAGDGVQIRSPPRSAPDNA
jgi:hypothetical protein